MFLLQLSSSGSSFLPLSRPALCRAGSRAASSSSSSRRPRFIPAPRPWWSVRGFPPWPSRLPPSPPAAHQVFSGSTINSRSVTPGYFGGCWCSFSTSAGLMMERHDKEPPHKRRKSVEDRRDGENREGHRRGTTEGKTKDGGPRPNHHLKDGGRDHVSGKGASRDSSRDKPVDRTRAGDKDRQRRDSAGRDDPANRWRSPHHGGHKDSQPARSRTEPPKSKPEQDRAPAHKPNAWFREPRGGCERSATGPERPPRDSDGGWWTGTPSQPSSTAFPPNPWQVASSTREPPPPGTSPPVGQQEDRKPVKPLHRRWEALPACSADVQPPGGGAAFDFSVMSYNILSQDLLHDNAYLYRHCDPAVLLWTHRLPNLLAEIQQHDADILCLQEVQQDHYENQIKPALQALGYQCEYKKRTGGKPDGCAVVFKSSRLSLLSSNPVEFFRPGDALLDRDNVGLVLLLQPKAWSGQTDPSTFICVANTHLLYNPRRGDIKLAQLAILLAEIGRLSRLPDGSSNPVVLCGDFNSTPWSPLYSFLTTGGLDYRGMQIGTVSGQESSPRGQRLLTAPIWSPSLGIDHQCQYRKEASEASPSSPTAVEGAISNLTVDDLASKAAFAFHRARIEHSLKLQSSYRHRLQPDGRAEITTCHSRTAMTVDYILYTPESLTPPSLPGGRGLQLVGRLSLVGQPELEEVSGLPNQYHSSDHLPLLARFRLRC